MTKGDAINLLENLKKLGNLRGAKFAYGVQKNISLLSPEKDLLLEAIKKGLEPSDEEHKKYEAKRIELAESFAKKDDKGKPIKLSKVVNGQTQEVYDGLDNNPEWDSAFEALQVEYKELLDARKAVVEEQNELIKTESTLALHKIALADVPTDISVAQMGFISEIVE